MAVTAAAIYSGLHHCWNKCDETRFIGAIVYDYLRFGRFCIWDLTAIKGPHLPTSNAGWFAMSGIVFIATIIPVVTFLAGLEMIGPTNAAMLSTLEPVVTVLLAAWLFQEKLKYNFVRRRLDLGRSVVADAKRTATSQTSRNLTKRKEGL